MKSKYIYMVAVALLMTLSQVSAEDLEIDSSAMNVTHQGYEVPKAQVDLTTLTPEELWDRGNTAYANDNFIKAQKCYVEILDRGVHSDALYYNLGNVYHKLGEVGESLLYYYKALKLSPADENTLHNIEVVKAKTKDNINQVPRLFIVEWSEAIEAKLSCMAWSIISLVLLAMAFTGLLFYVLSATLKGRRGGFWATTLFGALCAVATCYAISTRSALINPDEAVIMSSSPSIKSSPSSSSTELFILHEGTKVRITATLNEWCEIVIADGKRGWIERKHIETI